MTREELLEISNIIQISISEKELEILLKQLNDVIEYTSKVNFFPSKDRNELQFVTDGNNRFREDTTLDSIPLPDVLKNAPSKNEIFFKVPKVIE